MSATNPPPAGTDLDPDLDPDLAPDLDPDLDPELRPVIAGLQGDPPTLSPKWFYDSVGSALFEAITRLGEYHVTRADLALLDAHGPAIAACLPAEATVVELGIGGPAKARLLLAAMERPTRFVGVDVSEVALDDATRVLSEAIPGLAVEGWRMDFSRPAGLRHKLERLADVGPLVLFFPGSTIGNFEPAAATAFLAELGEGLPAGTPLLLGVDLIKPEPRLSLAYDDPAGVTAAFNRNALAHLNARFGCDFDPRAWRHEARWRAGASRVEMWLVAQGEQRVRLGGTELVFADGAGIHTESSHKYDRRLVESLAVASGWKIRVWFQDDDAGFAEVLLEKQPADG